MIWKLRPLFNKNALEDACEKDSGTLLLSEYRKLETAGFLHIPTIAGIHWYQQKRGYSIWIHFSYTRI